MVPLRRKTNAGIGHPNMHRHLVESLRVARRRAQPSPQAHPTPTPNPILIPNPTQSATSAAVERPVFSQRREFDVIAPRGSPATIQAKPRASVSARVVLGSGRPRQLLRQRLLPDAGA